MCLLLLLCWVLFKIYRNGIRYGIKFHKYRGGQPMVSDPELTKKWGDLESRSSINWSGFPKILFINILNYSVWKWWWWSVNSLHFVKLWRNPETSDISSEIYPLSCTLQYRCHFHYLTRRMKLTNWMWKCELCVNSVWILSTHVKLNCAAARLGCVCHASSS